MELSLADLRLILRGLESLRLKGSYMDGEILELESRVRAEHRRRDSVEQLRADLRMPGTPGGGMWQGPAVR